MQGDTVKCVSQSDKHIKEGCKVGDEFVISYIDTDDFTCPVKLKGFGWYSLVVREFIRVKQSKEQEPEQPLHTIKTEESYTTTDKYTNLTSLYSNLDNNDPYNVSLRKAYESLRSDEGLSEISSDDLFKICCKIVKPEPVCVTNKYTELDLEDHW